MMLCGAGCKDGGASVWDCPWQSMYVVPSSFNLPGGHAHNVAMPTQFVPPGHSLDEGSYGRCVCTAALVLLVSLSVQGMMRMAPR